MYLSVCGDGMGREVGKAVMLDLLCQGFLCSAHGGKVASPKLGVDQEVQQGSVGMREIFFHLDTWQAVVGSRTHCTSARAPGLKVVGLNMACRNALCFSLSCWAPRLGPYLSLSTLTECLWGMETWCSQNAFFFSFTFGAEWDNWGPSSDEVSTHGGLHFISRAEQHAGREKGDVWGCLWPPLEGHRALPQGTEFLF